MTVRTYYGHHIYPVTRRQGMAATIGRRAVPRRAMPDGGAA